MMSALRRKILKKNITFEVDKQGFNSNSVHIITKAIRNSIERLYFSG